MGVKEIHLIHAAKVEKSYWQAHQLRADEMHRHLWMGLELSGDTILPTVHLASQFRPFCEDLLPTISAHTARWVADPRGKPRLFSGMTPNQMTTLCIGPEGGWNDFELKLLQDQGFQIGHFGSRILSTETAVPAMIATFADKQNEV
jgi:RsmE family RNA methyltransferase